MLEATTTEQIYKLEKYRIMNTKLFTVRFKCCGQSSDGKMMSVLTTGKLK